MQQFDTCMWHTSPTFLLLVDTSTTTLRIFHSHILIDCSYQSNIDVKCIGCTPDCEKKGENDKSTQFKNCCLWNGPHRSVVWKEYVEYSGMESFCCWTFSDWIKAQLHLYSFGDYFIFKTQIIINFIYIMYSSWSQNKCAIMSTLCICVHCYF